MICKFSIDQSFNKSNEGLFEYLSTRYAVNRIRFEKGEGMFLLSTVLIMQGCTDTSSPLEAQLTESCLQQHQASDCNQLTLQSFEKQDFANAMKWGQQSCALSDAQGCFYVGALHNDGQGVPSSKTEANIWYKKSCDLGYQPACEQMQEIIVDSIAIMKVDCDQGKGASCYLLAQMNWDKSSSIVTDEVQGWLQQGCDAKDTLSCRDLGQIIQDQDPQKALQIYANACQQNDAQSCHQQAQLQFQVDQSATVLVQELRQRACDLDMVESCGHLGIVRSDIDQDHVSAVKLFTKACEGGYMDSCNRLAVLFQKGLGVEQNLQQAKELYQQACEKEEVRACVNLGYLYLDGIGVDKNIEMAQQYLQAACAKNDAEACLEIGELFAKGSGVEQSDERALEWFQKACQSGDQQACTRKVNPKFEASCAQD